MAKPPDDAQPPSGLPTPQQALEFMQRMWNPLGVPMPGFGMPGVPGMPGAPAAPATAAGAMPFPNPAMMFATLDPAEVERKIGELRVIENWLAMSLTMLQMSIKTMELQKASLEALRGVAPKAAEGRRDQGGR
ncbi:MAG: hypothetical protein IT519_06185 [Burkholderiales bacterium]|jgi:hypothetical protein|nr:hypothetical protein [Burkholderiales bacterium]